MQALGADLLGFAGALGIGLLIGVERERAKGEGPARDVAGVRTFALCGLVGAAAMWLGPAAIVAGGLVLGLLVLAGYRHTQAQDPGLTTEIAMLATFLLGMMALRSPVLAGGLGVVVAGLLAAKKTLHRFVKQGLSERELEDLLLLLAAAFIVLPLLPDRAIDPWGALVPRKLWMLVVAVIAVSSIGYVAMRLWGAKRGLLLGAALGGLVSSTAVTLSFSR